LAHRTSKREQIAGSDIDWTRGKDFENVADTIGPVVVSKVEDLE
jgi:hypothetical protein